MWQLIDDCVQCLRVREKVLVFISSPPLTSSNHSQQYQRWHCECAFYFSSTWREFSMLVKVELHCAAITVAPQTGAIHDQIDIYISAARLTTAISAPPRRSRLAMQAKLHEAALASIGKSEMSRLSSFSWSSFACGWLCRQRFNAGRQYIYRIMLLLHWNT